jgi:hypothetical protein
VKEDRKIRPVVKEALCDFGQNIWLEFFGQQL